MYFMEVPLVKQVALAHNNIAVWNETSGWNTLGSGSNGVIHALKLAS